LGENGAGLEKGRGVFPVGLARGPQYLVLWQDKFGVMDGKCSLVLWQMLM